jgi:hypothetical protein
MTVHRIPLPEYQAVDMAAWSYVMTPEVIEDRFESGCYREPEGTFHGRYNHSNTYDTVHVNVPLCSGCDEPIRNMRCDNCSLVFFLNAKHIGGGTYRVEA